MKYLKEQFEQIKNFDKLFTFDIDEDIKSPLFRSFFKVITELGSTIFAGITILILTLISGLDVLYVFVPIYLFQLIVVEILKKLFRRPRPTNTKYRNIFGLITSSGSFPSGHTSNIFTLAFLITNFYQTNIAITTLVFLVAGTVAFTRILLSRHFIIDVVAGAIIGLLLSIVGASLLQQILLYLI